jgi:hypothetical protein
MNSWPTYSKPSQASRNTSRGECLICQANPLQVSNHLRQVISNSQKPFMPAA